MLLVVALILLLVLRLLVALKAKERVAGGCKYENIYIISREKKTRSDGLLVQGIHKYI